MKIPTEQFPAGLEMDTAIAKALGWEPHESDGIKYWKNMADDNFPYFDFCACDYMEDMERWSPSTDVAAAWKLAEMFKHGSFSVGWSNDWGMPYCMIGDVAYEYADTIPLAICRAFLKAKGITEIETNFTNVGKNDSDEKSE